MSDNTNEATPSNDDCFGSREEMIARYKSVCTELSQLKQANAELENTIKNCRNSVTIICHEFPNAGNYIKQLETEVQKQHRQLAELAATVEKMRAALVTAQKKYRIQFGTNVGEITTLPTPYDEALSLTPSDALKEVMKPWVETLEQAMKLCEWFENSNKKATHPSDACAMISIDLQLRREKLQDQARALLATIPK